MAVINGAKASLLVCLIVLLWPASSQFPANSDEDVEKPTDSSDLSTTVPSSSNATTTTEPPPVIVAYKSKDRSIYARRASGISGIISDVYEVFVGPTNYTKGRTAVAVLRPFGDGPEGFVKFKQDRADSPVRVAGLIRGLKPLSSHGFNVHKSGNLLDGCESTLNHFNPYMQPHGGPKSQRRHVGDLGNIEADENGIAEFEFEDKIISLSGTSSVLGRAVVVHEYPDNFETESNESGKRISCGVIGFASGSE